MGKLKRNRNNRKARVNPLGEKKLGKDEQKDENTRQSKILPLINNLKSAIPNEKSMALGALTVICEDARMRKLCLKEKLVQIIMEQCLNDDNDEIVVESFGLLRNLGIEEGYDVIAYYWRQNIWVAIEAGIRKIESSFKYLAENKSLQGSTTTLRLAKQVDEKAKLQLLYDFTENILSLVLVLASGSEEIYENVFQRIDPVLNVVTSLINWNYPTLKTSLKLHNTLLDFIYEFSTESFEFIEKLGSSDQFEFEKLSPGTEKNLLGKGYIEGIKYQILETQSQSSANGDNKFVLDTLVSFSNIVSQIDLTSIKTNFLTTVDNANEPITKPVATKADDDKPKDIDQQIAGDTPEKTQAKDDIQLLEISVDIFTSVWEYLAMQNSQNPLQSGDEILQVIIKSVYPILHELIQFDVNNHHILQLSNKILVCFNNLSWFMLSCDSLPTEWFEISLSIWDLAVSISSKSQSLQVQKNVLNVLWAIIKTSAPGIGNDRLEPAMLQGLITKCNGFLSSGSSGNETDQFDFILSSVGFLGTAASVIPNIDLIRSIAEFLLSLISGFTTKEFIAGSSLSIEDKSRAYTIVIESMDLIYDIFGDAEYPHDFPVFVQGDYVNKLRQVEPQVKEMYKKIDKNKFKELKVRGEDAWGNLNRFIQYKESERK